MGETSFCLDTAKRRWEQGWTQGEIAAEQGVSTATAHRHLAKAGLGINHKFRRRRKVERASELAERIRSGETRVSVAKDLGISGERVSQIIELVMPRNDPGIWPSQKEEELRRLWPSGLHASEIGRRLGVSKSAVIGKAHRLDLPRRGKTPNRAKT